MALQQYWSHGLLVYLFEILSEGIEMKEKEGREKREEKQLDLKVIY